MRSCSLIALATLAMAVGGPHRLWSAAQAQSEPVPAAALLRRIGSACKADTARFCPALAESGPEPRDQYICLKAYKANLSFGCRGAVNAYGAR